MNKLGLKITKISAGVQELLTLNGGDWTRKVVDLRNDIKSLSGQRFEDGACVLMVSFTTQGSLLTLFHTIPGRSGDLVSAWIFVPTEVSISADEEFSVIEQVKSEILRPQVENWNRMETLFAKEYPLKAMYFPYKESAQGNAAAVRYYGTGTDFGLRELLGDKLYQQSYTDHRYVFLLDKNGGIIAEDKLVNYTANPLQEMIILTPPQLPAGVTAKINGADFSKPTLALKGDTMTLTLERPGFDPLPSKFTASTNPILLPASLPWVKRILPSHFQVADNEGNNLSASCRILLNGRTLTSSGIALSEEDCKAVNVQVECPGCLPYSNTFNLQQLSPYRVGMEKEVLEEVYMLNGKECPGLTECPEGYTISGEFQRGKKVYYDCTYDGPADNIDWKKIAIIASAAALLIGLLLGVLLHKVVSNRNETPQTLTDHPISNGTDTSTNAQRPMTYECLNKSVWKKNEIERVPELRGFFDDVILCKVDSLTGKWEKIIDPAYNSKWNKLLNEIKKHDAEILKDFQMRNDVTEISLEYYMNELAKHVNRKNSPIGQSGNTTGPSNTNNLKQGGQAKSGETQDNQAQGDQSQGGKTQGSKTQTKQKDL